MGIFDRFPYSSTHEMNLDFMLGKAAEIAEDMQTVATGMAQVQAGLSAISEKTEQATEAAAQAAQSASSIEGSVTAAEEAAEEAQMHNESAQTWANNAMTYKADCQRSATEAAASSASAAQAATAAAASEDTVATYAQAANASAQSAANNNDSAHQYANQASASASNATFHSSNAQTAATNAQTAATNANTSATNASASADRAATLKTDVETLHRMCSTAVDLAGEQAVAAANSAAQAAATKTDVENLVESLPEDFTDLNNTVNQLSNEIADVIATNEYTEETKTNIRSQLTWTDDAYMQPNGTTTGASGLRYSNQIEVSPGDVISYVNTNYTFRFITAFSSPTVAVTEAGSSNPGSAYTVPDGIHYVVLSEYTSRGDAEIDLLRYSTEKASYVKPIPLGYISKKGTLANGEQLTLPFMQVKNFNRYVFNANITVFSSVRFSLGVVKVEINSENLVITNGNNTTLSPIAHGLTIGKNITLIVETETEENINRVIVSSDGSVFTYTTKFYAPSTESSAFIASVGSSLTDCNFSWISQNINTPIWMFGDSYFSFYDTRWTYYLVQDGYTKNVMLNGYAGEGSAFAYNALVNLLAVTTPKIIVWCLGMNNPDTDSAVNADWKSYYDKIIELQKKYGFELILYTTPTTPTMNNRFKNAIVRESGYRYIEADLAVRIDAEGHWVGNGTAQAALASDNVHPTMYGAKILYYRILADLPELMCNM